MFFLLSSLPHFAWGWWDQGHETVAAIAQEELTSLARKKIEELLSYPLEKPGSALLSKKTSSIISAASWADHLKAPAFKNTSQNDIYGPTCHYLDLLLYSDELKNISKDIQKNIIAKIGEKSISPSKNSLSCSRNFIQTLKSSEETTEKKALALRYLIHVLADIHQPFHGFSVSSRLKPQITDRGGTHLTIPAVKIFYFPLSQNQSVWIKNMHAFWDACLGIFQQFKLVEFKDKQDLENYRPRDQDLYIQKTVKQLKKNPKYIAQIKADFLAPNKTTSLEDWALESILIGIKYARNGLKEDPHSILKVSFTNFSNYQKRNQAQVKRQLVLAGLRLGQVLNAIFDPQKASEPFLAMVHEISNSKAKHSFQSGN